MQTDARRIILVAILLTLSGCTSSPDVPTDASTVHAYKRLRVAVVEPAPTGDRSTPGSSKTPPGPS